MPTTASFPELAGIDPTRMYYTGDIVIEKGDVLIYDKGQWIPMDGKIDSYTQAEDQMNEELKKKNLPSMETLMEIAKETRPEYFV